MKKSIIPILLIIYLNMAIAPTQAVSLNNNPSRTISTIGTVNPARTSPHAPVLLKSTSTPVLKCIGAYGFGGGIPDETADFIADNFDLFYAHYNEASIPSFRRMKSKNPSLIILVYRNAMGMYPPDSPHSSVNRDWDIVNQHEDWFVHDKYGNRVVNKYWGWHLMDVGNEGWRHHYADWCEKVLQEQSIDGIFADDVWDSLPYGTVPDALWNPWTIPNSWIEGSIGQRWHNDTIGFIAYVKQIIGNKLLIINSLNNDDYLNVCDGKLEEEFVHPPWYSYTEFHDQYINWIEKVNGVKQVIEKGKYILVISGFSELVQSPSQDMVNKMLMYSFCSYLLALEKGDKAYFGFGGYWNADDSRGHYQVYDQSKALGLPVNQYYLFQSVYVRDFQNGKILVNPSDSAYTVSLGQNYKTLDGYTVSSVTLGGRTGVILLIQ